MPPQPQKRGRGDDAAQADERKRARAAGVVTRVEGMDADAADALLDQLCDRWLLTREAAAATIDQTIGAAFSNFGVAIESTLLDAPELSSEVSTSGGLGGLVERIHDHETEAIALFNHMRGLELLPTADDAADDADPAAAARLKRIVKVLEQVWYGKKVVVAGYQARLAAHAAGTDDVRVDDTLDQQLASWGIRFRWIDVSTTNPMQNLLLHLLDCAMERKYRKQLGWCYEPVVIDGVATHAWRQVMEIKDFVHAMISKETSWEQWLNATTNTKNISSAVEYLSSCVDYQFPTLRKQRGVYSFRNGVYVARDDKFHAFGDLPDSVVACKFFDLEFEPHTSARHWSDVPTPYLQSIMDYQQFPREVCDWMYILLGRLMYDLGDLDSWQVIPFFKGMASSGKSTVVLKVAKNFFEAIDVGVLSNNIERKFGLSAFADKYLFVAPEIKNDLQVEQAEFQSIVSGEDIQVNTKFAKAKTCVWKVPGVLAGNEVPGWADNSGSIQRRIVLFDFSKAVSNGDMKLGEKLEAELAATILKCNRAYLEMVSRHSHTNLWQVLPRYFHNTRDEMAQAVNSVEAFLASHDVVLREDLYMPFKEFKEALRVFEQTNGYRSGGKAQTADFWRGPFAKFRLERVHDKRFYQGQNLTRDYVVGVDLARLDAEDEIM
jgi:hypothetical protein